MKITNETERQFAQACVELKIRVNNRKSIESFLAPLRDKDPVTHFHYLHSLRVGLLAREIGRFIYHEEKPLFYAGILHDVGKCQVALEVLGKTEGWTDKDSRVIKRHVTDGYRLIRGRFNFSAEIMLWHHRFQHDGYPKQLPRSFRGYPEHTKLLIAEYGRIVALADVYDALHRLNNKLGKKEPLSGKEIQAKMLEFNPDRTKLVLALYDAGIFVV